MSPEKTQKLYSDFPHLYRGRKDKKSLMHWGFSCKDGWFQLIYDLSAAIEAEARRLAIKPGSKTWPKASQVKQKWGSLRFYLSAPAGASGKSLVQGTTPAPGNFIDFRPVSANEKIRKLVAAAEAKSCSICEICGAPGVLRKELFWQTRCDRCEADRNKRNQEESDL